MRYHITPPFAPSLVNSTRFLGYTLNTAIADLIDNSITAKATFIKINYTTSNPRVWIFDDGIGMTNDELHKAMTYGYDSSGALNKDYGLGRYGLGLKTASLSQCKKLTVISKKNDIISIFCWDIEHIISTGKWELIEFNNDEIDPHIIRNLDSVMTGTIVVWDNIDILIQDSKDIERTLNEDFYNLRSHLGLIFHRFISAQNGNRNLNIYVQNNLIKAIDPFIVNKSKEYQSELIEISENNRKHIVKLTPYILPHSSRLSTEEIKELGGQEGLIKNQGFYLYREDRLIHYGSWFGLVRRKDIYKLSRVRVDVPRTLDFLWNLDVKKSSIQPPEQVIFAFKRILNRILEYSENVERFRAKNEKESKVNIWLSNITRFGKAYTINREFPIVKELLKDNDKTEFLLKIIENEIPVHQIIVDSSDDQQFAVDVSEYKRESYVAQLKILIDKLSIEEKKKAIMEWLSLPPFNNIEFSSKEIEEIIYDGK